MCLAIPAKSIGTPPLIGEGDNRGAAGHRINQFGIPFVRNSKSPWNLTNKSFCVAL